MMNREEQPDIGKRFLPRLAAELISRYGVNPEHLKVILPGKRARLFLGRAWAAEAGKRYGLQMS